MVATLVAVATLLAACSTTERELFGTLSVSLDGNTCRDVEGASVEEGTGAFVFDFTGEKLAAARLADRVEADGVCTFAFRLSGVPTTESSYAVRINDRFWRLSRAELDAGKWWVDLYAIK